MNLFNFNCGVKPSNVQLLRGKCSDFIAKISASPRHCSPLTKSFGTHPVPAWMMAASIFYPTSCKPRQWRVPTFYLYRLTRCSAKVCVVYGRTRWGCIMTPVLTHRRMLKRIVLKILREPGPCCIQDRPSLEDRKESTLNITLVNKRHLEKRF